MTTAAAHRDRFLARVREGRAIMGILNVTPDSFSDGGRFLSPEAALAQAKRLVAEGADILDVGAESTRPGHAPVAAEEEWRRLADVLPALAALDAPLSIDTTKPDVARRALGAGACVVNDQWGFRDPAMASLVAEHEAGAVLMHNRETVEPDLDIVADIDRFFARALETARAAGVPQAHILLDPGIGFGKTKEQNLRALAATGHFARHGRPILIGVSRKSIFGALLGAAPGDRLVPTIAANLATAAMGARAFRVHDVREHRQAFAVVDALAPG